MGNRESKSPQKPSQNETDRGHPIGGVLRVRNLSQAQFLRGGFHTLAGFLVAFESLLEAYFCGFGDRLQRFIECIYQVDRRSCEIGTSALLVCFHNR